MKQAQDLSKDPRAKKKIADARQRLMHRHTKESKAPGSRP
jgi:hypothetical protein